MIGAQTIDRIRKFSLKHNCYDTWASRQVLVYSRRFSCPELNFVGGADWIWSVVNFETRSLVFMLAGTTFLQAFCVF